MGTGIELATIAPYAVAAAGAYTTAATAADAKRKQDKQTAAGIAQQIQHREASNKRVNQNIDQQLAVDPNAGRKAKLAEYLGALQQNRSTAGGQVGATSGAYQQGAVAKDKAVGDVSSQLANVFARTDASGDLRRGEALGLQRTASDIGVEGNLAGGDAFSNQMAVNGITANPWMDLLGKAGVAAGGVMANRQQSQEDLSDYGSIFEGRRRGTIPVFSTPPYRGP